MTPGFCEIHLLTKIVDGEKLPKQVFHLGEFGQVPLLTIGDCAFPQYPWLVKGYFEAPNLSLQQKYIKRLCSARVVMEDCYGMLNGRWGTLYKKTECHLCNLKYVIMASIMLHNFCIAEDPCMPRWLLKVKQLDLIEKETERGATKCGADLVRLQISNWLWSKSVNSPGTLNILYFVG